VSICKWAPLLATYPSESDKVGPFSLVAASLLCMTACAVSSVLCICFCFRLLQITTVEARLTHITGLMLYAVSRAGEECGTCSGRGFAVWMVFAHHPAFALHVSYSVSRPSFRVTDAICSSSPCWLCDTSSIISSHGRHLLIVPSGSAAPRPSHPPTHLLHLLHLLLLLEGMVGQTD
jgi:hypothetical protein